MKIYKREIRPYCYVPAPQGFSETFEPVKGYGWVSESMEEQLKNEISFTDPWASLQFKERYVEVGVLH